MTLVDLYCRMWSTWQAELPKSLAGENTTQILKQILRIADIKGGISQSELQRVLGLNPITP